MICRGWCWVVEEMASQWVLDDFVIYQSLEESCFEAPRGSELQGLTTFSLDLSRWVLPKFWKASWIIVLEINYYLFSNSLQGAAGRKCLFFVTTVVVSVGRGALKECRVPRTVMLGYIQTPRTNRSLTNTAILLSYLMMGNAAVQFNDINVLIL